MTFLPILCSNCGLPMTYQGGQIPERPICEGCQADLALQEDMRARVNCDNCPAKVQCEEADRRGL